MPELVAPLPPMMRNDQLSTAGSRSVTLSGPVLRTTDANYKGLKKDFLKGKPIKEQISRIRVRRVSITNLLNPET
ncbi:uncharacterized protein EAF02_003314 [Botrytis sinoallii]|uniref:uncharacterized protein n=1 Tax=Botrytis sinoallii TaxID=1463999 RepID=UPI0018FFD82F|nr:uncharacterized protein EAF02_003314 [Botrytis sinoallii]KAF7886667.1 hypothetical protein EAF02_003314 [Botrytis sinoallii]